MKNFIIKITILLVVAIINSCNSDDDPVKTNVATSIELISGDNQFAITSTQITEPIVLMVKNELEEPLAGVQVVFEVTEGSISSTTLTTDNDGKVSVNWTLGDNLGIQTLTAKSFGANGTDLINSPIHINATAISSCITKTNATEFLIPDNESFVRSSIHVVENLTVTDVNVTINILHDYVGDLRIILESPSGATIPLCLRRGGSDNNFINTTFDDDANISILDGSAPFNGVFKPESLLFVLNGSSSLGEWRLFVEDVDAGVEGTLINWSLELCLE